MTTPADLLMVDFVLDNGQAAVMEQRAVAAKWLAAHRALELARREPWVLLGVDSRAAGAAAVKLAESALIAELAVRTRTSEGTVRSQAHTAQVLLERLPLLWERFAEGFVPQQNAVEATRLVADLPQECWREFDQQVAGAAAELTARKFRLKALGIRERIHPTTADTRHASAREQRRIYTEVDRDGMGWFGAYLPVDVIATAQSRIDRHAFGLARLDGESRTMAQLRADVLADLLTGDDGTRGAGRPAARTVVSLALTIPMLSLLGQDSTPAVLDGVGPIPMGMAKALAGLAPSFVRVLTDPVTGTVLDMEARTRRIPKAMRRFLQHRDRTCTFPGCTRPASNADIDHTRDVQHGGLTANGNLAHLCRRHHTLKHQTAWRYVRSQGPAPGTATTWTSPLGHITGGDPPPF